MSGKGNLRVDVVEENSVYEREIQEIFRAPCVLSDDILTVRECLTLYFPLLLLLLLLALRCHSLGCRDRELVLENPPVVEREVERRDCNLDYPDDH